MDGEVSTDEGGGDSDGEGLISPDSSSALIFFLSFASGGDIEAARLREDLDGFTGDSYSCLIAPLTSSTGGFFAFLVGFVGVAPVELLVTLLAVDAAARALFDILDLLFRDLVKLSRLCSDFVGG